MSLTRGRGSNVNPNLVLLAASLCVAAQVQVSAQVFSEQQRGLLDDTLGGGSDFGRTPVLNPGGFHSLHDGRNHNIRGSTVLLTGGGVKAGLTLGATDEFRFKLAENPVYVNDLHATILYLMRLDHTLDVAGGVVKDIIAGERA